MTQSTEIIKTYRYVRLAMVGLVVGIFAAVCIERGRSGGGFKGSISAYYYTPARGMFVAAVLAIGVCLVCIRGANTAEDVLLNLAGMLAPVVALVPTPPSGSDPDVTTLREARRLAVANNFPALLLVGVFAVLVLLCLIAVAFAGREPRPSRWDVLGFGVASAVLLAAYLWYRAGNESFLEAAHYTAAIAMFVFIAFTAIIDGAIAIRTQGKVTRGWFYVVIGVTMLLAGAGIIGYHYLVAEWDHHVLVAEAVLIFLFGAFWAMQTVDLWNHTSRRDAIAEEGSRAR